MQLVQTWPLERSCIFLFGSPLENVPVELQQFSLGDRFFGSLELRGDQRDFGSEKEANQTGKEDWREGSDIGQFC